MVKIFFLVTAIIAVGLVMLADLEFLIFLLSFIKNHKTRNAVILIM